MRRTTYYLDRDEELGHIPVSKRLSDTRDVFFISRGSNLI